MLRERLAKQFRFFSVGLLVFSAINSKAGGEIVRWDNSELILNSKGITPGPGMQFPNSDLTYAGLRFSDLQSANFQRSNLAHADFTGSSFTDASFASATVAGAKFDGATVNGASFDHAVGLTNQQLYSTASYAQKNLPGIHLGGQDLSGWDFSNQDLTNAQFNGSTLWGASLSGALVAGANFRQTTLRGFTKEQLYATASYEQQKLQGILLGVKDLTNWDLSRQDLSNAGFDSSTLTGANMSGAIVDGASFRQTTSRGFTKEQLYATASYQQENLRGIDLSDNNLSGWDLSGQDLKDAKFHQSTLTNANLSGADLRGATGLNLIGANLKNSIRPGGRIEGLDLGSGDELVIRDDDRVIGTTRPPNSSITIHDHAGGLLRLVLESDPWDSLITFQSGIPIQLGGILELDFAPNVHVSGQNGRSIQLFDWGGVMPTGAFVVESRHVWDTSRIYSSGEVTLLAAVEPIPEPTTLVLLLCGLCAFACISRL